MYILTSDGSDINQWLICSLQNEFPKNILGNSQQIVVGSALSLEESINSPVIRDSQVLTARMTKRASRSLMSSLVVRLRVEQLEDRRLLTHCGPFDLGDGHGPKFVAGDTITEDFSDNPHHEDPATVPGGFDSCEAQGDRLFTHTTTGASGILPIEEADIPFDQVRPGQAHILIISGQHEIEFRGIHPEFHVAAVSFDILAAGSSTVDVYGESPSQIVSLNSTQTNVWEQLTVTRGTPIPGTTNELEGITRINIRGNDLNHIDNVTVLIVANEVNDPPQAFDNHVTIPENPIGEPPETHIIDVIAISIDPEEGPLVLDSITPTANGTAVIDNNQVHYTPASGFRGQDQFDYTIRDDGGLTDTATVFITVGQNRRPVAVGGEFTFPHGTLGPITVGGGFDPDGDLISPDIVSSPNHGTLTINADRSFQYTPTTPTGLVVSDNFAFRFFDGALFSQTAVVTITVPNQLPVARDVFLSIDHGVEGRVFAEFLGSDPDADSLTYQVVSPPAHGLVTVLPNGMFAYERDGDEYIDWRSGIFHPVDRFMRGPDSFTYRATDALGATSAPALVSIDVPNHAPITNDGDPRTIFGVDSYRVSSTNDGPGTADHVFSPVQLENELPAHGQLRLTSNHDATAFNFDLELFEIQNVVSVRLHLDDPVGPTVAELYAAAPGGGFVIHNPFLQGIELTESSLMGPFSSDFPGFLAALRDGRIHVNVFTDDGIPIFNDGQPVETGPGDFFLTGEISGRIALAGEPTHFAAPGPLWNDNDLELQMTGDVVRDPLVMVVTDLPDNGTLFYQPGGSFTYYPRSGYEGLDGFTYLASDGHATSEPTQVLLDVVPANQTARLRDDELHVTYFVEPLESITENDDELPFPLYRYESLPVDSRLQLENRADGVMVFPCGSGRRYFSYVEVHGDIRSSRMRTNNAGIELFLSDPDWDGDGLSNAEEGLCSGDESFPYSDPARRGSPLVDTDDDGVNNRIEAAAPNGGDGNDDGVLDIRQPHVTSLPDALQRGYVTLVSLSGAELQDVSATRAPGGAPVGVTFPFDVVNFTVSGVYPGIPVAVELILPNETFLDTFYKYGRTPDNPIPHWYEFLYDGTTGAELVDEDGNGRIERILLHLLDGQRGDDDLAFNGKIVDPGGPASAAQPVLDLTGPEYGVRGQPLQFQFEVTPPGSYSYNIDWDGDGTVDQQIDGTESLSVEQTYSVEGNYTISASRCERCWQHVGTSVARRFDRCRGCREWQSFGRGHRGG